MLSPARAAATSYLLPPPPSPSQSSESKLERAWPALASQDKKETHTHTEKESGGKKSTASLSLHNACWTSLLQAAVVGPPGKGAISDSSALLA